MCCVVYAEVLYGGGENSIKQKFTSHHSISCGCVAHHCELFQNYPWSRMEKTTGQYFRAPFCVRGICSVAVDETACADQTRSGTVAALAQPVAGGYSAIRGDDQMVVAGNAFGTVAAAAAAYGTAAAAALCLIRL